MSKQGNNSRNGASSGNGSSAANGTGASGRTPVWTGTHTAIVVIMLAFLAGFFSGQEFGQTPVKITPPAPVMATAPPPDSGAADSTAGTGATGAAAGDATEAVPSGHDDATLKKGIARETDPTRLRMLAELFIQQHRFDLGGLAAAKAVQLNPGDATSHALLGISDEGGKHDPAAARVEYQKALKLNPPTQIKDFVTQELARLEKS